MYIKHAPRYLAAAALMIIVASAFLASTALAKLAANTIHPIAIVNHGGTRIRVTGPIRGDTPGELCQQRVTVTQRSTGAVAQGLIDFRLTGAEQTWEVICHTYGEEKFLPGSATAVGLARTLRHGDATDSHQWLVNITIQQN